jgi:hypothetical protein
MRSTTICPTTVLLVVSGLLLGMIVLSMRPLRPQIWLYPLARQAVQIKMNYDTKQMAEIETEHFRIKYTPEDEDSIPMIAEAAEAAYAPVTHQLSYVPAGKTLILVQPSKDELRRVFGWSGNESAMGVYWGGVIQLLSPHIWLKDGSSVQDFIYSGPLVHEYTHLIFDYITNGNYPRWFTEGLAQYVEYCVNGYEWQTKTNDLRGTLYTMAQLEDDFDQLPDQSLAYRESLAAVRYIDEVYGERRLQDMIHAMKAGQSIEKAMGKTLGLDYQTFSYSWQQWAVDHMSFHMEKH